MRFLRRFVMLAAALVLVLCIVLLLNITAPNPTGRRYSSEMPLTTGEGNAGQIGGDGERILAHDLRLPNNNLPDQRQCICGFSSGVPGGCNLCLAHSPQVGNYRIPDFVGAGYIAEAKNVRRLLVTHDRDFQQIGEMAAAAREAGLAFWLYVRADTVLDPAYFALMDGLRGGIVYYFAVPGYLDPVDQLAQVGLLSALVLIALMILWELIARKVKAAPVRVPTRPPKRDTAPDPLRKADDAGDFVQRARDRTRRQIDIDESRHGKH